MGLQFIRRRGGPCEAAGRGPSHVEPFVDFVNFTQFVEFDEFQFKAEEEDGGQTSQSCLQIEYCAKVVLAPHK